MAPSATRSNFSVIAIKPKQDATINGTKDNEQTPLDAICHGLVKLPGMKYYSPLLSASSRTTTFLLIFLFNSLPNRHPHLSHLFLPPPPRPKPHDRPLPSLVPLQLHRRHEWPHLHPRPRIPTRILDQPPRGPLWSSQSIGDVAFIRQA